MGSLDSVAETVLHRRYLQQDEEGTVVETPDEMFHRVAANLAKAEAQFGGDVEATEERFYETISSLDFLPNSPTLMNAGTELQQLAACFVLPVKDSIESIFTAVKQTALIHQSGGGTGFSFSRLRPEGDIVKKNRRCRVGSGELHENLRCSDRADQTGWSPSRRQHGRA